MTRIFLTGYMGSGKTTLGRALAADMRLEFIDLDHYIEKRYCKSIAQLFAERGEVDSARLSAGCCTRWASSRM